MQLTVLFALAIGSTPPHTAPLQTLAQPDPARATCERSAAVPATGTPDNGSCALRAYDIGDAAPPVLDGRLDETVWTDAEVATGFVQQDPTPGAAASQRTEARVLYTSDAVYVGMRMFDDDADGIRAQFVRRDDHQAVSDWASVMFDSYFDRRTAFEFATTPTGTRVDILHLEDVEVDVAWNAVWDVATSRDADGWSAEFRIPLSQLRFASDEDMVWGVNFGRTIARNSETSYWAELAPTAGKVVSLYGDLVGLRNLSAPGGVELLPYTIGRLARAPENAADPFYRENDTWSALGLDLKYGLTSNLTLTATFNPDFGQVEADPSEVNLTAFETFYAEKRPFFTEGTEIFNFRIEPEGYGFYSRRIGRAPQLRASVPAEGFADAPETARILGAVKLSGKTASGWSVGLVEAVTGRVDADVSGPAGIGSQALEPLTSYTAGRVMRDFREGQSGIGVLGTATHRKLDTPSFEERLRSAAYLGAFDWFHRFGSGNNHEFNGFVVGSHARGSMEAMARAQRSAAHFFHRSDAEHLTYDPTITSMNGYAWETAVERIGGGNLTWTLGFGGRSPGIEMNDLGFLSYADTWYGSATARYSRFQPSRVFRNWYVEGQWTQGQTWGLESIRSSLHLRMRGTFANFWQLTVNTDRWFGHKWPWELRGGPALERSAYVNSRWILRSDSRKPWTVQFRGRLKVDDQGGARNLELDPRVDFRPTSRLTVSLEPFVQWNRDADQYVARVTHDGEPDYVLGRIDQTTASMVTRLSYGFSPTLNLDLYALPFVSSGRYDAFRTVADAGEPDFDARLPLIPAGTLALDPETNRYDTGDYSFGNPDFDVREFRLNAVLRWEYRPGSTLFLVWTQAREDDSRLGGVDLGRDLDRLFVAPATNVFMVKFNYWLGL